jgi:hypothetical protein
MLPDTRHECEVSLSPVLRDRQGLNRRLDEPFLRDHCLVKICTLRSAILFPLLRTILTMLRDALRLVSRRHQRGDYAAYKFVSTGVVGLGKTPHFKKGTIKKREVLQTVSFKSIYS